MFADGESLSRTNLSLGDTNHNRKLRNDNATIRKGSLDHTDLALSFTAQQVWILFSINNNTLPLGPGLSFSLTSCCCCFTDSEES